MVLPAILAVTAVGGGLGWVIDKAGLLDVDEIGGEIGEVIADGAEIIIDTIPPIMSRLGPALVEGTGELFTGLGEALEGRETAFFTGLTMALVSYAAFRTLKSLTR